MKRDWSGANVPSPSIQRTPVCSTTLPAFIALPIDLKTLSATSSGRSKPATTHAFQQPK